MIEVAGEAPHGSRLDQQRIGDRVASGALLLWATTMVLRLLQLTTTAILARLLMPADFGLLAVATTIVGLLDVLSDIQIGGAIVRTQDLTTDHVDTAFTIGLMRGTLTACLLAALAHPLAHLMRDARLEDVLYGLAVSAFLGSIHNTNFLLYARNLDFAKDSRRNAVAAVMGSCAGIVMAFVLHSYWALVAASITTSFFMMLLSYWRVPGRPRLCLRKTREILSYGSWLLIVSGLDYVNSKIDYFLIDRGIGSSALGAYHVGQQVTLMATGDVVAPLSRALLPAFSMISGELGRLRSSYQQVQSITLALALPIGFGTSAVAENIILLIAGRKWEMAVPVIRFLAPIIALQTTIASIESLALAKGEGRLLALRTVVFLGVRSILMFAGFYMGGFLGIIYARVISGLFYLIYGLNLAASIVGGRAWDPLAASWRSLVSVAVMWLALRAMPTPDLLAATVPVLIGTLAERVSIAAVVYTGCHLALWRIAGRPAGAERRLLDQFSRALRGISMRLRLSRAG